jgi:PilZ domain
MIESASTPRTGQGTGPANGPGKVSAETAVFLKQLAENAAVFLQRPGADASGRHTGIMVGNIRDQMLVIGIYDGAEFEIGERLILRMGMGAHLVGFDTKVLKKSAEPQLYFIQFPDRVEAINLRKAQRIQAFFPADVKIDKEGSDQILLLKTRVLDISAGGCSFRSKTKFNASSVSISFALPGERHIQSIKGSIIDSIQVGMVFHSRVKFSQDPGNQPILQEVAKWVAEGLSFGAA